MWMSPVYGATNDATTLIALVFGAAGATVSA